MIRYILENETNTRRWVYRVQYILERNCLCSSFLHTHVSYFAAAASTPKKNDKTSTMSQYQLHNVYSYSNTELKISQTLTLRRTRRNNEVREWWLFFFYKQTTSGEVGKIPINASSRNHGGIWGFFFYACWMSRVMTSRGLFLWSLLLEPKNC